MSTQSAISLALTPRPWRARVAHVIAAGLAAAGVLVVPVGVADAVQDPASCPTGTIALVNGGFEQPVIPANTFALRAEGLVNGWETSAADGLIELWNGSFLGVPHAEGVQHAELNANSVATLFQDVATVPGATITYRVFHRGRAGVDNAQMQFGPPAGPANFTRLMTDGNTAWGKYTGSYTIPAGQTTTRFAFASISAAGGSPAIGNFIDGVQFGTAPCVITDKTVQNLAGTDPAHPGDVLQYSVTATNEGGNDAGNVVVTDSIPAGTAYVPGSLTIGGVARSDADDADAAEYDPVGRLVTFRVGTGATGSVGGTLGSAAAATVTFRVVVLSAADGTTITNAAVTSFTDPILGGGTKLSTSNDASIAVVVPAVHLVKSHTGIDDADGDGQVSVGDGLAFAITARNAGTEALSVVTVSDSRVPALACGPTTALGTPFTNGTSGLAVGDQVACTGTLTVTQADVDAGEVTNTASVAAEGATGIPVADDDSVTVPTEVAEPALDLIKTASPASGAQAGDDVDFTMVATNVGNVTLDGVTVTDPTLGSVACVPAAPATLLPGQAMACTGSRTVTQAEANAGQLENTAEATGTDPVGTPVTDTATVITPTAPRVGLLTLDKAVTGHDDLDGNGSVSVGDGLDYELVATNSGNVTQTGVTISDPRVGALSCTPSQPATLAPGTSLTCTGSITVTQAEVDAGEVVNTATATGTPPPGVVNPPTTTTVDTPTEPARPALSVVKNVDSLVDADLSGSYTPGDTVTYRITTANTGNVLLQDVLVADPLLGALSCDTANPTTLAPSASITCTGTYAVTAGDATTGTRENTATAAGLAPGGVPVGGSDTLTIPITTPTPQVTVTKSVVTNDDTNDSGSIDPGDSLTYEVVVTNTGNVALTGITVEDSLVPLTCATPPTLAPGQSFSCQYELAVTQAHQDAGEILNTVLATGLSPTQVLVADTDDSVVATEGRRPDATFVKVVTGVADGGDGSNDVGDVASFELTFTNTGNVTLSGAHISDDRVTTLDCTPVQPASLAPGDSLVCTGSAPLTQADQDSGVMTDHGIANADHATGSITREDRAVVPVAPAQPALTTVKTADVDDADGSGDASVGEVVTYTITATNTGNVTLHGVTIIDPLVPDLECAPAAPASLAPGDDLTCTGTAVVTQADVDAGHLVNVATATGEDPTGTPVTGVGTALVETDEPAPALTVTKTFTSSIDVDGSDTVTSGDSVVFTIVATNTGNVTLDDVEVTDPLVPDLDCAPTPPATLAPGDAVTCTGSVLVTQAHVDAGAVVNQATATGTDPHGTPVEATGGGEAPTEPADPELAFNKVAELTDVDGSGGLSSGDVIRYTITATNTGNVTLDDLTISDPMLPSLACDTALPTDLAPDGRVTCTGTHTVTTAESAAGRVTNTATADAANLEVLSATAKVTRPATAPAAPLPRTGGDVLQAVLPALVLLGLGTSVLAVTRRRRTA